MSDIISLQKKKKAKNNIHKTLVLFQCKVKSGKRMALVKSLDTGQIGFAVSKDPDPKSLFEDITMLCEDEAGFIYDKIMSIWEE